MDMGESFYHHQGVVHHGFDKEVAGRFLIRSACPALLSNGGISGSPIIVNRAIDPLGHTSTCTYDEYGQLIRDDQPLTGGVTLTATYSYDNYGNCTQVEDTGGHTVTTSYTSRGLVAYTIDKAGAKTSYSYNTLGWLLSLTDTLGNSASFTYDACGRQLSSSDSLGLLGSNTYDDAGRLIRTVSPTLSYYDGSSLTQTTTYDYNNANRLTSVIDPAGKTTSYSYDDNGNVKTKVGPSNTTTYTYDTLNHLTGIVQGGSTVAGYSYNGVGQRIGKVAGGLTSSYLWDGSNLAVQIWIYL